MPEHSPPHATEGLSRLNEADATSVRPILLECLAVPGWAEQLLSERPYPDTAALLDAADTATAALEEAEVLAAVRSHPRIGERQGGDSESARWSASEQSGVSRDADVSERLAAANSEYERRFGHVYLVCATGMGSEEILADLRSRLGNDLATEVTVIRDNLGEIAKLRLKRVTGQ